MSLACGHKELCGEVPASATHVPSVSDSADEASASQASRLVAVRSFLQPFLYDPEDPGHLQLPRILRNILSQFSRPCFSLHRRCQDLTSGGHKKATRDRTVKLFALANKALRAYSHISCSLPSFPRVTVAPQWSGALAQDQGQV